MDYITITTPENIEIKYRLASVGSRTAAYIIDLIILTTFILILSIILSFSLLNDISLFELTTFNYWFIAIYIIAIFIIYFGYFIISELTMKGQSIGKKLFKLRVIKENGQPVNFTGSLVRNLFRYFVDNFGIGVISMFFSKKCKRVGDMAASTMVITEDTDALSTEDFALSSFLSNNQQIITNEKYILSYDEYNLLKEYFNRRDKFFDGGEKTKNILCQYYTQKFSLEPGIVDENVLYKLLNLNIK